MTAPAQRFRTAAEALAANRLSPGPLEELPDACRPTTLADAYAVQSILADLLAEQWGEPAGFKIGCTTEVMQQFLGIDHPCAGHILAARLHEGRAEFPIDSFHRVGVECEIAVSLGLAIDAERLAAGREAIAAAIASHHTAIEIVDARYCDYTTIATPTLVADDFFQAAAVIGEPRPLTTTTDISALKGHMTIDGKRVGAGRGADILGHPLAALEWLARQRIELGAPLDGGVTILLGSVVQTQWIEMPPGGSTTVEVAFEGLTPCQVEFRV